MLLDNKPSPYSFGVAPFMGGTGVPYAELAAPGGIHYEEGPPAAFLPDKRIGFLDEEGIDTSLIYPSCGLLWGSELTGAALNDAYTRAHNDWAVDYCGAEPGRLFPVAFLPVLDIERAVAEVRRKLAPLTASDRARILGDNARDLFCLDD